MAWCIIIIDFSVFEIHERYWVSFDFGTGRKKWSMLYWLVFMIFLPMKDWELLFSTKCSCNDLKHCQFIPNANVYCIIKRARWSWPFLDCILIHIRRALYKKYRKIPKLKRLNLKFIGFNNYIQLNKSYLKHFR